MNKSLKFIRTAGSFDDAEWIISERAAGSWSAFTCTDGGLQDCNVLITTK